MNSMDYIKQADARSNRASDIATMVDSSIMELQRQVNFYVECATESENQLQEAKNASDLLKVARLRAGMGNNLLQDMIRITNRMVTDTQHHMNLYQDESLASACFFVEEEDQ